MGFGNDKARVLDKADLSRKGSVDADIKDLVAFINDQAAYSCSGKIVIYVEVKMNFLAVMSCTLNSNMFCRSVKRKGVSGSWCSMNLWTNLNW